jgi:hypothetical protein
MHGMNNTKIVNEQHRAPGAGLSMIFLLLAAFFFIIDPRKRGQFRILWNFI